MDRQVFTIQPLPGREMCDFCCTSPTARLYACRNFMWLKHSMFAHESIGAWAACEECARLVDGGKWSELAERALAQFKKAHGYSHDEEPYFREQFREINRLFKEHMITGV